jgi:TnpA family transposase
LRSFQTDGETTAPAWPSFGGRAVRIGKNAELGILSTYCRKPRFKNLKRQRLYIFKRQQKNERSTWKIKPTGYCDIDRVIGYSDEIIRFIVTIKLKETTASDLVDLVDDQHVDFKLTR